MATRKQGIGSSLGLGSDKASRMANKSNALGVLKILAFVSCLVIVLAGFSFLDRYVKNQTAPPPESRTIELVGVTPDWVSEEIKNRIFAAATARPFGLAPPITTFEGRQDRQNSPQAADANNIDLEDNTAASIQRNIARLVPWLADVQVQTTHNSTLISGRWRRPIALVTAGNEKFFLDTDLVILDYIPVTGLSVVTVIGLQFDKHPPVSGQVWQGEDLSAALAVLERLERMDANVCPTKPLLRLIDRIDVSNYDGRQKKHDPHIILFTKDNIQIIWGAEIGAWQRHLESTDEDKLAKLYTFYQQNGKLSGVKYINLRDPQQTILLPIDKY